VNRYNIKTTENPIKKLMIASDIHGSAYYCKKMIERYRAEHAERLVLLGDILYHGPRNDLPRDYAPKDVIKMLNPLADEILCVRGNCDTEVDQMVLDFSVMSESALIMTEGAVIYATHGHIFGEDNPPPIGRGGILLCGHTHIPACRENNEITYMNPGSVSIPKENSENSCMTYENGVFSWMNLDGKVYAKAEIEQH